MVTVALIVTGDMERLALPRSLARVFSEATFTVQKVDSFTSAKVVWPPPSSRGVATAIEKYATAFVSALVPGRRDPRPDFVFGIDDLELANREQPDEVIRIFRLAVQAVLDKRRAELNLATFDRLAARVKECCSFHLLVPMVEAYFFAVPETLERMGCTRRPNLREGLDVEAFETDDPDYLNTPVPPPSWAIELTTRRLHPKRYVEFLFDPRTYQETQEGNVGLAMLDWRTVLSQHGQTLFLRAFFQDLAHAVGRNASDFPGETAGATSNYKSRDRIIRNF